MALVTEAIRTEVAQLYVALFGRAPLAEGLGFYAQKMASGMTVAQVAQEMYNLDVARPYYPSAATAEEIVTSFFRNVLGREPADAGKAYWVGRLNAANQVDPTHAQGIVIGEMIDSVVAYSGVNATALEAKALFNNKVTVALAYNQAQSSNPDGGFPAGLSNDTLRDLSDDILSTVTASSNVSNARAFVWNFLGGSADFELTTRRDVASGYQTYNSQPEYTPGGDDFVNTLQDEDSLVGTVGANDTLNVLIGAPNDAGESIIAPVLRSIEVVNAEFTGGSAGILGQYEFFLGGLLGEDIYFNSAYGLSFQNTDGVREVNIDRITDNNAYVVVLSLQDSTTAISLSDTRPVNGLVEFNWAEGELAGSEAVTLTLDNVRLNALNVTAGDWMNNWEVLEDEGYGIEQLFVNVNGTTNIDQFTVFPNGAEPVAGPAMPYYGWGSIAPVPPGSSQTIEFTTAAGAPLEINSLVMPGAETIIIHASAPVLFTGNERTNLDGNDNNGLDTIHGAFTWTEHLELITIDGTAAGDVWLNGVNSGSDGDTDVVIEGSEMFGNLAARIENSTAANTDSSVDSGFGDDEIVTTGTSNMAITTRDGADHVHIGQFGGGDSNDVIRTGAGADRIIVQGDVNADIDTWSAIATNVTKSATKSDTAADGDSIRVTDDINSANVSTGEGNDTITVEDTILKTKAGSYVIDMANGNDVLLIQDSTDDISLAKGYTVEMGAGNDLVDLDQDNAGAINTSAGNDTVYVRDDILEGASVTTGADDDHVLEVDDLEGLIDTGAGNDRVNMPGDSADVEGTGVILTGDGNDTVYVGDDLDVRYQDYVGTNNGPSSGEDDGITTETEFTDEEQFEDEYGEVGAFNALGSGKTLSNSHITETKAGRIETGTGNDIVTVGDQLHSGPQWNDNLIDSGKVGNFNADDTVNIIGATILTGSGKDTVTIGEYDERDDSDESGEQYVLDENALIDTGADDDTVTIHHNGPVVLRADNSDFNPWGKSQADYPGGLTPTAPFDVYYVEREVAVGDAVYNQDTRGAMVYLGTGNDAITFNDVAFDVSPNPAEREAGVTSNNFNGVTVIVDRGAIVDGSEVATKSAATETDTLTVRTVDLIDVVQSRAWHAIDADKLNGTDSIVVGGINAKDTADGQGGYIRNIDTINLVIENTVSPTEENDGVTGVKEDPRTNDPAADGYVATDDDDNCGCEEDTPTIRLDVFQVNTDLEQINLVSNEQRLKLQNTNEIAEVPEAELEDPYYVAGHTNGFIEGQMTAFEIDSFRQYDNDAGTDLTTLTLKAYESSGLTPWHNGDLDKDGKLDGSAWPYEGFNPATKEWVGEGFDLRDDCDIDVTVSVNMDAYAEWNGGAIKNRGFTLDLLANDDLANQTGEGNYDVEIISQDEYAADADGNPVLTKEDSNWSVTGNASGQTVAAEGMTQQPVNALEDDLDDQGSLIRQYARDITLNVKTGASHAIEMFDTYVGNKNFLGEDTSLTVNVTNGAGQALELDHVRADVTKVTGASDIYLYMLNESAGGQKFKVDLSGTSGNNLIDMVDDGVHGKAFDDTVTGGTGNDLLLLAGGDDIASFAPINGVESLALIFEEGSDETSDLNIDASGALNELLIVNYNEEETTDGIADEDDINFGMHTVNVTVTGAAVDANRLTINADVDISEDLEPPFCNPDLDSTRHSDDLLINVETKGVERTDLDIWVNTAEGTQVRLKNDANEFARVYATVSALADTYINDNEDSVYHGQGDQEGELRLSVLGGGVDEIYLINADRSPSATVPAQGTGSNHNVFVKVEDTWATNVDTTAKAYDLKIDASAINTTDNGTFNVWNELDGSLETDANLYIIGSQDRDDIDGGRQNDTLDGGEGTDLLYGHRGNDSLVGGTGNDQLAGDDDGDTIANGGNDTLRGGDGADLLYGGVKADVLTGGRDNDFFTYTRRADSNSGFDVNGIDTITDFNANGELTDTVPGTDLIDVRNLAFDPAFLEGSKGDTIGQFLTGKKMVFGIVDEVSSMYLGGNGIDAIDAQSRTFAGNGIIEVAYQQDQSILWFDLNDDGTLNNNDLRIRVALPAGATEFEPEWINGVQSNGDGYTNFFQAVYSDSTKNVGAVYSLGTVVSDHVIISADKHTGGYVNGLEQVAGTNGALATFGGNDQVTVLGSDSDDDLLIDLGDGNDTLAAGAGDETLVGGDGNDSIAAGDGDDEVYGGNGDDTVFGEAGEDYIEATPGNDYLDGGEDNDEIISSSGNDTLYGRDGDDILIAGRMSDWDYASEGDRDYVDGGAGNDQIITGSDDDIAIGGDGTDSIYTDDGDDSIDGGAHADSIYSGADDDTVWGGTGSDDIYADSGNDWVDAGSDDDHVHGEDGDDTVYGQEGDDDIDAGSDDDYVDAGLGDDDVYGEDGDDKIYGREGDDWLEGNAGSDLIEGGSDDDIMFGGNGSEVLLNLMMALPGMLGSPEPTTAELFGMLGANDGMDTLHGDAGDDIVFGGGNDDIIAGGEGSDELFGDSMSLIDLVVNAFAHSDDFANWEELVVGDDSITGGAGEDYIEGGAGDDTIDGGVDSDLIWGDWGIPTDVSDDSVFAGLGSLLAYAYGSEIGEDIFDAFAYNNGGDDKITAGEGEDIVYGGGGDDTITGDQGGDLLWGMAGDDSIDGGDGNDDAFGGDGDDWIHGRAGNDGLHGEDGDDTIVGGDPTESFSDSDSIYAGNGDDIAWGYDGEDLMMGEDGDDTLYGGDGEDLIAGGNDDDLLYGEEEADLMSGGAIYDPYGSAEGWAPSGYVGDSYVGTNAVYTWEDASDGDDTMFGGRDSDTMFGSAGDDHVDGGNGDDRLYGDWAVGEDVLDLFSGYFGALPWLPGMLASDVDAGNDVIHGDDGDDTIQGGFGDDTISGGDDDDLIFGEYLPNTYGFRSVLPPGAPGADWWLVDSGEDIVDPNLVKDIVDNSLDWLTDGNDDSILGGSGDDTILGDISYDLGNYNASVNGVGGDDTIRGGDGDDLIGGGGGDDLIYGDDGYDTIYGGYGNDTIYGGDSDDTIYGGDGNDYVEGGDSDDEIWGGSGDDTLLGNDSDDYIEGEGGDDSILGGDSDDTIDGGTGDDDIYGGDDEDSIVGGVGDDYIDGGAHGDDIWGGADDDTIIGNSGSDWLDGETGDDSLMGGTGNDTMLGGSDDDWLWGESGNDSMIGGDGADSLYGGEGSDDIYMDDVAVSDDDTDVDWVHLNLETTVETVHGTEVTDEIWGFDVDDPVFDDFGPNDRGDWLALLEGDVTYGTGGGTVTLTDWSKDAYYETSDSPGGDITEWYYNDDPALDTVGSPSVSIANARLVIVRTQGEDDKSVLPAESYPDTSDSDFDDNDITDDFDYDYTQAEDVDLMLSQQNGAFNGSVFVLTDDAGASDDGTVYLWWDADVADQNDGDGVTDTVLVGVFHNIDDAETFLGNVQWIDSWPMSS